MSILLQNKTKEVPALLYVAENMELMSAAGRRRMYEQPLLTDKKLLKREQDIVELFQERWKESAMIKPITLLRHQLMQLHDLHTTLKSLASHTVLEEVELFEIKNLSYISGHARKALAEMGLDDLISIPDLQPVFDILDPDKTGITSFYIYDSYDIRLGPLRKQMKGADDVKMSELLAAQNEIQLQVQTRLCDELQPYAESLSTAMELMAYTDFAMAKAELARKWGLVRPAETVNQVYLHGLFNPRLRDHNEKHHLRYQPIDIELTKGVTFVTGANMAGKTVLLKSVGIAQLMYQFGFPVPAVSAHLEPVDDVVFCIGDEQNEMNGLSSYAAEITRISSVIMRSKNEHLLVLIDEPARTTNPIEGKALVQSIATLMEGRNSTTMITTHYSQLGINCRRLRVKGFVDTMVDIPLSAKNINLFIDYSLVTDETDEVPHEALRIAEMLDCDEELIRTAKKFLFD